MEVLKYLIIHCSATRAAMNVTGDDIRAWHTARGWKQVGYSDLIRRDGTVENLVPYDENPYVEGHEITNGAINYNTCSRHVCLAGGISNEGIPEDNFTQEQKQSLYNYISEFLAYHPGCVVIGHNEVANKACPCFDVQEFLIAYGLK